MSKEDPKVFNLSHAGISKKGTGPGKSRSDIEMDRVNRVFENKNLTNDSIVNDIINKFKERSIKGEEKYGTNLDRTDLSLKDWLKHAIEEHMDAILYLNKALKKLES